MRVAITCLLLVAFALSTIVVADEKVEPAWVAPMRAVHNKFTGKAGTFAHFGDSITVTKAFWSPLQWDQSRLDERGKKAFEVVSKHMNKDCWGGWKGPKFGNEGGMTIVWAVDNIDQWLKVHNPETALIMFGTNDLNRVPTDEYEKKLRMVIQKCLDNGTVVILTTIPPRAGQLEKCRTLVEIERKAAGDLKIPLIDYFEECLKRRPDDWDGSAAKFKVEPGDTYNVSTLICRDGVHPSAPKKFANDYSEEGLKSHGYNLRTYLTLVKYAEVVEVIAKR